MFHRNSNDAQPYTWNTMELSSSDYSAAQNTRKCVTPFTQILI